MYRYDTRLLTCFQQLNRLTLLMPVVLLLAFGLSTAELSAQSSATPKNVYVPLTVDTFGGLSVTTSETCVVLIGCSDDFSGLGNLTDSNLGNSASTSIPSGSAWIQVSDGEAISDPHPAGSYVGFVANDALLGLGSGVSISIYRNDIEVQSESIADLLSVNLGGDAKIGFYAEEEFDAIRFTYNAGLLSLGTVNVYYAEIMTPDDDEAPNLGEESCNLSIPWVQSDGSVDGEGFPVVIEPTRTGISGIGLGGISGLDNVVDSNTENFASMVSILGLPGASGDASISVRTLGEPLEGGTFAGFEVSTDVILSVGLLDAVTITTYLNGAQQDVAAGDALIASVGLLGSSDQFTIGFQTSSDFDEIQITTSQGLLGLSLDVFNVYHPVVTNFCEGAALECRTDTPISTPDFPVFINAENTGVTGLANACLLGDCIEDMDNLINENPNEGAVITPLLSSGSANISVKFGAGSYGADGSNPVFVGFDIGNASLLEVDVLSGITITTFFNGSEQQSSDAGGNALVEVGTDILTSDGRRTVGFAATQEFDEVQLSISSVVGVELAATTVYQLVLRDLCPGDPMECGETANLEQDSFPVIVNSERTGVFGAACVGCSVENANALISPDSEAFTTMTTTVGVLGATSVSVLNPVDTYQARTVAGFVVDTNSSNLVELSLLEALVVCTYINGSQQECSSGSELITLTLLIPLLGQADGIFNVGFVTTKPYDEIVLRTGDLLGANVLDGSIDVYNAFVEFGGVDSDGNSCPDITISLTGGSCFRTLSSPVAGLTYAEMLAPLWTQGADGSNHEGGDPNIWTWPSTAIGNAQTSWVPLVTMDAVIPAGSGFLMSVFDHDDYNNQNEIGRA